MNTSRRLRNPLLSIALITAAFCLLLDGCLHNSRTIWSEESPSPDGLWLATAHTDEFSGPGNAGLYTQVELKRRRGPKETTEILLFDFQSATPDKATVEMKWLTPTRLDVTYAGNAVLDFQVVKCAGIDISVQDLSNDIANDKTPK